MGTDGSFRSIANWLSDKIALVSRKSFLCHASFWLQVKQRTLWFAQLLSKPVRLDPCVLMSKVPVARLLKHSRHSFQCFPCFQVKLAGTNFKASIYLLSCGCLKASCALSSPCVCLPTWPSAQHAHPRKATSINRGEEEMLQLMATNASFRSIASWLCDNIVSMREKMYGFFDMSCTLQLEGMAVICLCFFTSKSVNMNATVKTIPLKTSCVPWNSWECIPAEKTFCMTWLYEEICSHGLIRVHATFQPNMSLMLAKNHVRKTGGVKDINLPPFSS